MRRHLIVGTSGHIDHGKTSLIKHLTGVDADRWEAEKERGITIDIGFAHLNLSDECIVGFVDVPGHERFIKNMVAGASGMDMVMLIVSAEDGFMPQTYEHMLILSHLNIKKGIVVFTKTDLVDEETLELLHLEADEVLKDTFLETAPRIEYSIYNERAKEELLSAISESADALEDPPKYPSSRLAVDRVFSIKGHGTVITGTLTEGQIDEGEILHLYPAEESVRVKGVQVYGQDVQTAFLGQRVALNISAPKSMIKRGDVLTSFSKWKPSHIIDVLIKIDKQPLKHWQRLRVYHGTRELLCRVAVQNQEEIQPGESHLVQLRLEEPLYCKVNDPIVVRNFSPMVTIGGGKIINPIAKKHDWSEFDPKQQEEANIEQIILKGIEEKGIPVEFKKSQFEHLPYPLELCEDAFEELITAQMLIHLGENHYVSDRWWQNMEAFILENVATYHKKNPLRLGLERETLRSQVNSSLYKGLKENLIKQHFNKVIDKMLVEEKLEEKENTLALKGRTLNYTPEQKKVKAFIEGHLKDAQNAPLSIKQVLAEGKEKKLYEDMLYHLIIQEKIVKISEGTVIATDAYRYCKNALIDILNRQGQVTVAEYRDELGLSRKMAIEMLEYFDKIQLTKRVEDQRVLIK